ncbi:MAG: hypothetical protein HND58_10050 [Planctomycetota bacterium]|nr:MAG: hypothetical protein HND58_10050 [Planctomycetota bacterium]
MIVPRQAASRLAGVDPLAEAPARGVDRHSPLDRRERVRLLADHGEAVRLEAAGAPTPTVLVADQAVAHVHAEAVEDAGGDGRA